MISFNNGYIFEDFCMTENAIDPQMNYKLLTLTHKGWATHICVSKLIIIGSDNGLSPERRQANIWSNAGILLIETLLTNFSAILSEIHTFSFKEMHLETLSEKRRPFCPGLNVLMAYNKQMWSLMEWDFFLVFPFGSLWVRWVHFLCSTINTHLSNLGEQRTAVMKAPPMAWLI